MLVMQLPAMSNNPHHFYRKQYYNQAAELMKSSFLRNCVPAHTQSVTHFSSISIISVPKGTRNFLCSFLQEPPTSSFQTSPNYWPQRAPPSLLKAQTQGLCSMQPPFLMELARTCFCDLFHIASLAEGSQLVHKLLRRGWEIDSMISQALFLEEKRIKTEGD